MPSMKLGLLLPLQSHVPKVTLLSTAEPKFTPFTPDFSLTAALLSWA